MIKLEQIITSFRGNTSPPTIYLQLNEIINGGYTSLSRVSDVISEDSSLSARLLKLVNSPFYGFPKKIETISEAVILVGSHQVRDLALVTLMMNSFKGIPEELVNLEMFWRHSLAVGIGSKILSEQIGESTPEKFFVAGVLHDIGRLILFSTLPKESLRILERAAVEQIPIIEIETKELGISHCEIGRVLLERWKLPYFFHETVAYHHAPERAQQYPKETAIVHIADIMAHALQIGNSGESFVQPFVPSSWSRLDIPTSRIFSVMKKIQREAESVFQLIQPVETE
jgi:HD-like signal output (HDOD) protein